MDLQNLANIAIKAALAAGQVMQKAVKQEVKVIRKEGGNTFASQVVTKVDFECERVILSHLNPTCKTYDLGLLTEEQEDDNSRFKKDFFWCIDPMDGTLAFINKTPGFSVSIALIAKDGTPQLGVVYDPSANNLYAAIKDKGAFKNGKLWDVKPQNNFLTYVTDKKLADTPNKAKIQEILNAKINTLGLSEIKEISGAGAVMNAIYVAENTPAILLKLPKKEKGGGSIWDFAANACIFKELGLKVTNFEGDKLDFNKKESSFMNEKGVSFSSLRTL